jgi:hypothetical protein
MKLAKAAAAMKLVLNFPNCSEKSGRNSLASSDSGC